MKIGVAAAFIVIALNITALCADKIDPRLATVRHAFVKPFDSLTDDQPVAVCVADRLVRVTPIEAVKTLEEADVVLIVSKASIGMHPKANLTAELSDGTKLWYGGSRVRGFNLVERDMTCVLAEDLLGNLRDAMKKARANK